MALDADGTEAALREQLLEQLDTLSSVNAALADGSDAELCDMREELSQAVAELEAALLEIIRSRLLEQVDRGASASAQEPPAELPAIPSGEHDSCAGDWSPDRSADRSAVSVRVGGTYRFRYTDGRWHVGLVTAVQGGTHVELRFMMPTSEAMLGGVLLPAAGLRPALRRQRRRQQRQCDVSGCPPGSRLLARLPPVSGVDAQLWQECQLVGFEHGGRHVTVQPLGGDGSSQCATVAIDSVAVSQFADSSSASESADLASGSDSDGDESGGGQHAIPSHAAVAGVAEAEELPDMAALEEAEAACEGASAAILAAAAAGRWQGTVFADFEAHTRGIGSKLLAAMGYVAGTGLGRNRQGIAASLQVQVRKQGAGLGLHEEQGLRVGAKKKSRGGERSRRRKHAEAQKAHREATQDRAAGGDHVDGAGVPELFTFMNRSLGGGSEAAALLRRAAGTDARAGRGVVAPATAPSAAASSRGALAAQADALKALRQQVMHLQSMAARNAKDKGLSLQIAQRLGQARDALTAAEAQVASSQTAIKNREDQKKWMKF